MTRAKAIQKHCFDCAGGSAKEVTMCELTDCPLWPYRTGQSLESKVYLRRMAKYGSLADSINKSSHILEKVTKNALADE